MSVPTTTPSSQIYGESTLETAAVDDFHTYQSTIRLASLDQSLTDRLHVILSMFEGRPYQFDPIGDGVDDPFDQRPLVCTTSFDCMTLCSTVIALLATDTYSAFLKALNQVRYGNQTPGYFRRHHFIESQWNEYNRILGYLASQMPALSNYYPIHSTQQTIHYPNWVEHQKQYLSQRSKTDYHLAIDDLPIPLRSPTYVDVDYIQLDDLRKSLLDPQMQGLIHGCIMQLVCPNWNIESKIGTSIAVCHLGITLLESDSVQFTHAHIGDQVVTVHLIDYLDYISAHMPHVIGVRFERLVNKRFCD